MWPIEWVPFSNDSLSYLYNDFRDFVIWNQISPTGKNPAAIRYILSTDLMMGKFEIWFNFSILALKIWKKTYIYPIKKKIYPVYFIGLI